VRACGGGAAAAVVAFQTSRTGSSSRFRKFIAAGEDTLLLDEIDTLGLEHQATLLRVAETGEFEPVASNEIGPLAVAAHSIHARSYAERFRSSWPRNWTSTEALMKI
jgi:transcriptional regulator with AAA-type ATPase domain